MKFSEKELRADAEAGQGSCQATAWAERTH